MPRGYCVCRLFDKSGTGRLSRGTAKRTTSQLFQGLNRRTWLYASEAATRLRSLKSADYHEGLQILIQQAMAQRKTAYASAMWIATLYAEDGDKEMALTWLAKGYDEKDPDIFFMRVEPALDSLHSDPRFQRLSALIGVVL
jgi:hypothetical protein